LGSFAELLALSFGGGGGGVGAFVEVVVLVVGLVGLEEAGGVPSLDGGGVDVEEGGDLVEGEHALCAEAVAMAGDVVVAAEVEDDAVGEGLVGAALEALSVEVVGGFSVGVGVQELIDAGEGAPGRLPGLVGGGVLGDGEGGGGAAAVADVEVDAAAVALSAAAGAGAGGGDGDVLDDVANEALPFALGGVGVVPDAGDVVGEGVDAVFLFGGEGGGVLGAVEFVLGVVVGADGVVPVGFEGVGDEAVGGVDGEVAAAGGVGFVAGAFDVQGAEPLRFVGVLVEFGVDA
jgi:hypothetical protein